MANTINQQWRIAARPDGNVKTTDFKFFEEPVRELDSGEFLLRTHYLNLAPVMRMYMQGISAAGEKPLDIGDVIHGRGVAQVIATKNSKYAVGDVLQGQIGWQTHKISRGTTQEKFYKMPKRDLSYSLGVSLLGMTGFSAYCGFVGRGSPKSGDVVLVSGAGGGVGSIVIQIAKILDCKVIGIAGGDQKCQFVSSLGADQVIDYKKDDIDAKLSEYAPRGLDIYFDNVGGEILTTALDHLAMNSRVVLCGSISEYMRDEPFGPTNYTNLRATNSSMNGFFVYNHQDDFPEAESTLADWISAGKLKIMEDITEGFDQMPEGLAKLYAGKNKGVALCRVRQDHELLEIGN